MASATVVDVHHDGTTVFISVRVASDGNKEYTATVLLSDLNALPNNAAKKAALVTAVKVIRDAQVITSTDLSAVASGTVTI